MALHPRWRRGWFKPAVRDAACRELLPWSLASGRASRLVVDSTTSRGTFRWRVIPMTQIQEDTTRFTVLVNDQGRYALWPEFRSVPAGWQEVLGPHSRQDCLDFVTKHGRKTEVRSVRSAYT